MESNVCEMFVASKHPSLLDDKLCFQQHSKTFRMAACQAVQIFAVRVNESCLFFSILFILTSNQGSLLMYADT